MKFLVRMVPVYLVVAGAAILLSLGISDRATQVAAMIPLDGRICIVLDAGHGEPDGGAVSCTGVEESGINLEITRRLDDLLHLLGYDTKMIRKDDHSVHTEGQSIAQKKRSDLKERVRIANETENAILLSIHQNHYSDSRYSGAQMFYAKAEGSEDLAKVLQMTFVEYLNPGSRRMAKPCQGIYLMEHVTCPAVLVECGFLSNPQEEAQLRTREYQLQICCVIATSVSNYLANT